jgi:hypothetical protein
MGFTKACNYCNVSKELITESLGLRSALMNISRSHLAAISRLFSSAVFRVMAAKGKSLAFVRLLRELKEVEDLFEGRYVSDLFETAHRILSISGCRDEYIYKSALTQKVLLGTHSLRTACMISEFRIGARKADLVILNGTATVYEIKSERDSLSRLAEQIAAYKKVFAKVVVIAGENHIDNVLSSVSGDIGVLKLCKRHRISPVREAQDRPDQISPIDVFDSIRIPEAKDILSTLGIESPTVPNTLVRAEMRKLFSTLKPERVHTAMVQTLKKSRNLLPLSQLVDELPPSLQAAALTLPIRKADHSKLVKAVKTPLTTALRWA